jgi:hypothetical protein
VQVDATPGKSFDEFAAFDLSIDNQTAAAIADIRQAIGATDTTRAQLDCLWRLVRLEPNPGLVTTFMRRVIDLFGELDRAARWHDLAAAAARYSHLTKNLRDARPDVANAIDTALGGHWTRSRTLALLALHERDEEGSAAVRLLLDAFGPSLAVGFVELLDDASLQSTTRSLIPLMCDSAALLAPGLVMHLGRGGSLVARAIVRVLGFAGAGYEVAISEQLASRDEQTVRAALRALARIGTARAAALVAFQIHNGGPVARGAEAALWHFPPAQTTLQIRDLLSRREFVLQNPEIVARLIDRLSPGTGDLGNVLEELEALRFHVWSPGLVRVALKARGLRTR